MCSAPCAGHTSMALYDFGVSQRKDALTVAYIQTTLTTVDRLSHNCRKDTLRMINIINMPIKYMCRTKLVHDTDKLLCPYNEGIKSALSAKELSIVNWGDASSRRTVPFISHSEPTDTLENLPTETSPSPNPPTETSLTANPE